MNTIPATLTADSAGIHILGRHLPLQTPITSGVSTRDIVLGVRPEDLTQCSADDAWFSGELMVAERLGSQTYGYVEIGHSKMLSVEFPRNSDLTVGDTMHFRCTSGNIHLFDASSGRRLS